MARCQGQHLTCEQNKYPLKMRLLPRPLRSSIPRVLERMKLTSVSSCLCRRRYALRQQVGFDLEQSLPEVEAGSVDDAVDAAQLGQRGGASPARRSPTEFRPSTRHGLPAASMYGGISLLTYEHAPPSPGHRCAELVDAGHPPMFAWSPVPRTGKLDTMVMTQPFPTRQLCAM